MTDDTRAAPTPEASTAWPVRDVLAKLATATEHLLRDHDCDHHGYEEVDAAVRAARTHMASPEASAPEPEFQHCQSCPAHPAYRHECLCAHIRDHSTCIGHD